MACPKRSQDTRSPNEQQICRFSEGSEQAKTGGIPMNKKISLYCRVSTDSQNTDNQRSELIDWVKRRGWKLLDSPSSKHWPEPAVFVDVISGAKCSRPALDRMLSLCRSGAIDTVVCVKLDRLGRSLIHLAHLLDEFRRLGVSLICTSQGIDTSSDNPAAQFQVSVLSAVAEFERGLIVERVRAGLKSARARGVRLGREPLDAAALRPRVLEQKMLGLTVRQIAQNLGISLGSVSKLSRAAVVPIIPAGAEFDPVRGVFEPPALARTLPADQLWQWPPPNFGGCDRDRTP